ncbi:hypothetical protein KAU08_06490 [bacterium]|nr:hypothetical protein [bacterium]
MDFDWDLAPAPEHFRCLFKGQALAHLDEFVLSWRYGDHPISWGETAAVFKIRLVEGPGVLFRLHAPGERLPARIEVDVSESVRGGISYEHSERLWCELAVIGNATENAHAPLVVSLGKFSRGDRKVFLAYALTIARQIAIPRDDYNTG